MTAYWLVKSEPSAYSIDTFEREKIAVWDGVRNFEARNNLQQMQRGDAVLFYQSVTDVGIAGLAKVFKRAYPDPSQFDPQSPYYDRRASLQKPLWFSPELQFVKKLARVVSLRELKAERRLSDMRLIEKGSRLSVHKLSKSEFELMMKLAEV